MKLAVFSIVLLASLTCAAPAAAQEHCPGMHEDPLGTLDDCLAHHQEELATEGIYESLLVKVLAAQDAAARGQADVAIRILEGFIHEAEALSDLQITGDATHVVHHAELAIAQLGG